MTQPPTAPLPPRTETLVREYRGGNRIQEFRLDADRLSQQGWRVANQSDIQPSAGCMRGCLLGLMALVWKPAPILVVTYERLAPPSPEGSVDLVVEVEPPSAPPPATDPFGGPRSRTGGPPNGPG